MADRSSGTLLSESHAYYSVAKVSAVDDQPRQFERSSPLCREYLDLRHDSARLVHSFIAATLRRIVETCDRLGVPWSKPRISARSSAEAVLTLPAFRSQRRRRGLPFPGSR